MPNLQHDAKNPTDLLGRPITNGDIVAWGTTFSRSPAICVARIAKIRFIQKACSENSYKTTEVAQQFADDYQLQLVPIISTGTMGNTKWDPEARTYVPCIPKLKTVHIVKNVVKLDGEAKAAAERAEHDALMKVAAA